MSSHQENHGSVKSYVIGFILSIILTVIPYYLVVNHSMEIDGLVLTVMGIAVLQLLIQVIYFLHLSFKPNFQDYKYNSNNQSLTIKGT